MINSHAKKNSITSKYPLLIGIGLVMLYGILIYAPELVELKQILFLGSLSPFESILFTFYYRFVLSGIFWGFIVPIVLLRMKSIFFQDLRGILKLFSDQISKKRIYLGIMTSVFIFISINLAAILLGVFTNDYFLLISPEYENGLGWFVLIFALIPGVWEEVAFRGFLFSFLKEKYTERSALLLNGVLFSIFHIFNYFILKQDLDSVILQLIAAIPVGIALAYTVVQTNSIVPAIFIHYTIDVTLFTSGFIFNLSDPIKTLIFAILSLIIIPPLVIILTTWRLKKYLKRDVLTD
jgi:membrane protease YdiL (CAAX protease family)